MKRIIIVCEGPTEASFCKDVLGPEFQKHDIYVETPLIKKSNGGIVSWPSLKRQIENHLLDKRAFVTMMVDYYGIKDSHAFPQWEEAKLISDKALVIKTLCEAMHEEIREDLRYRFIPYIQLHEFEGLLFSDVSKFKALYAEGEMRYDVLEAARDAFENPELINSGHDTAPSKRLIAAIPSYTKVLSGDLIAEEIGLEKIRKECPLFDEWVCEIENIG